MPKSFVVSLVIGVAVASGALGRSARAQTTISISMAAAPAAPRIQPPLTVGATPGTPFLYTVPVTGQPSLTFLAAALPAGLSLDPSSGVISGTAPPAGSYPVAITVTNAAGSATATLTIASGSPLRPTPPMGWNSYDAYGASISESEVLQQAQAIKAQLQPFGWSYVVIDYRWYDPEDSIDENGRFLPSPTKYPSAASGNGFKTLASEIHALGLGFGIHIMRGIPRAAVTANAPIAGATTHATDAANTSDACPWDQHMWGVSGGAAGQAWYDALFAQYAQWGVDFVKIDDMLNNSTKIYHQAEAAAIRAAVDKSGRAMVVSFSPGADDPSWLPSSIGDLNANADMWRIVDDFWDYKAITDLPGVFRAAGTWQAVSGLVPGHWPDADMLPLGYLGPRCEWHASGETMLTRNQQVAILSLWSLLPSPLIFGGNPQSLTTDATTGPWTLALLTNEEVLAVNQDSLGTHAKRIAQQGSTEVWARDLSGGRKAVALFNNGTADATVSVTFAQLGVTGAPSVRDLWQRADVAGATTGISRNVPNGGALMYTVSPTSQSGGAGGSGATGGAGGHPGTAGAGGAGVATGGAVGASGGSVGSGGRDGSGGTGGGSGGAPASGGSGTGGRALVIGSGGQTSGGDASGGTTGTGGAANGSGGRSQTGGGSASTGTGGGAGNGAARSSPSEGCACAIPAPGPSSSGEFFCSLIGGLVCIRRRSSRPRINRPL